MEQRYRAVVQVQAGVPVTEVAATGYWSKWPLPTPSRSRGSRPASQNRLGVRQNLPNRAGNAVRPVW